MRRKGFKAMSRKITLSLNIHLETDTGEDPSDAAMEFAREAAETAIHERLFGEGFLPSDTIVDDWNLRVSFMPCAESA